MRPSPLSFLFMALRAKLARGRKEGWTIAPTRLMKRKTTPGLPVAQSIKDCTDYGKNPVKTEEGKYIAA